jgi:hypothetical protein
MGFVLESDVGLGLPPSLTIPDWSAAAQGYNSPA